MNLPADDCDDCRPSYLSHTLVAASIPTLVISTLPFTITWAATVILAKRRLFPLLSPVGDEGRTAETLPQFSKDALRPAQRRRFDGISAQKLASWVFSISIGLSAVLVELLLCEISNTLDPIARGVAMRTTLTLLLILSVVLTPAIEIMGLVKLLTGSSDSSTSTRRYRPKLQFFLAAIIFATWLLIFWYIPQTSILRKRLNNEIEATRGRPLTEACLERVGIIGISLMASLSGFAAVSSLWQSFGVRYRTVSESDINRKESGLEATSEMLSAKESRLRALQRKLSEQASSSERPGFMGRMMGSLRSGSSETQELKALEMEVAGLQTMRYGLASTVATLRSRHAEQQHSHTLVGRVLKVFNTAFALYCAYRISATSLSSLRRWWQPDHSFATSDPVNNILAILTTHWDSNLDREAWSRQFSFLLSGAMLFASFSAVLQTFRLFARFAPSMIRHAQTSLPLIISQIAGAYVISSALLLRSNLPPEVRGVISDALGAPLEAKFVEGWFESWFLVAVGLTAIGILIGRKVGSGDDWDDYDDGFASGGHKRS